MDARLIPMRIVSLAVVVATSMLLLGLRFAGSPVRLQAAGGPPNGLQKIKHVVIIMQENRSFDTYFGAYPGADGLAAAQATATAQGKRSVCLPDPRPLPPPGACDRPFHDTVDVNYGANHNAVAAATALDGGRMDGFVDVAYSDCFGGPDHSGTQNPACGTPTPGGPPTQTPAPNSTATPTGVPAFDVMGYHTSTEIPNYWRYAHSFVLQDHMFEPVASWSDPSHLYLVSNWSASCAISGIPDSCQTDIVAPTMAITDYYGWTDITYLLHHHVDGSGNPAPVSWAYYVASGTPPDCINGAALCGAYNGGASGGTQSYVSPSIWNPLALFATVHQDGEISSVQPFTNFVQAAQAGTLPAVSWLSPSWANSEHPPSSINQGQAYVTSAINAIMQGPNWSSTAIFLAWDDWGGFYDHEVPPTIDGQGYGFRVPSIVISPYAKQGYIDHQVLSFDAFNKFIEDDFLGGQRLDPATDGRPDPRPDVRENLVPGDLVNDFDFTQPPRPPLVLPPYPKGTPTSAAGR